MSLKRKRRKSRYVMPEVSLTPLIDTALTLLVIFMVTAPAISNNIKISLPQGASKEAKEQQEFVVTVSKDDQVYFNSFPVELENIGPVVMAKLEGKLDSPVFLRADESISYGKVIGIIDNLKKAGVRAVAMSTREFRA